MRSSRSSPVEMDAPVADDSFDRYLKFITPVWGDPTYSILKAHLLVEELLRIQLRRVLPHPEALSGSRLTFAQLLALVRACSDVPPDYWCWVAVAKLNKLRNMLSHEAAPTNMTEKLDEYVRYVVDNSGVPLPVPGLTTSQNEGHGQPAAMYLPVDMATIGLYYALTGLLRMPIGPSTAPEGT